MEELMYFIWQQRLFESIQTINGIELEVINPGLRNLDTGPDFFNAKIRLNGTLWAGNVEMHVKASDWYKHKHQSDPIYDSIILHVVMQADAEIKRQNGEIVPTVILQIPQKIAEHYYSLTARTPYSFSAINCKNELPKVPKIIIHDWQNALAIERMLKKVRRVKDIIDDKGKSWPEALYVSLARALGTGVNSDACEMLARSIPFSILQKHLDNPLQIEALLIGQAGLIDTQELKQEYNFLQKKFNLTPLSQELWKMAKARPYASPQVRLRALAKLLVEHKNLLSEVLSCKNIDDMTHIFIIPNVLGRATVHSLIINAIVPIVLTYGQWKGNERISERAIEILKSLPPETNRYMEYWEICNLKPKNAFESQAMLQLYKEYCEPHKCMRCRIGCHLLRYSTRQSPT